MSSATGGKRCVKRLRWYAFLRSYFVDDVGDLITSKGSTLLAPAKSADSTCKLFNTLPEDKIDDYKDAISWSWQLSNSYDVAISVKAGACKFSQ